MIDIFLIYPVEIKQIIASKNQINSFCAKDCLVTQDINTKETINLSLESVSPQNLSQSQSPQKFTVFPVGLNLFKRNVIASSLIKGSEDGTQAINFKQWLIPFDDVVKALNIKVNILDDGQLELRSPGFVVRIKPQELTQDPELGLSI